MNTISKILFWTMTIALGFVNPLISIVLVILYYLPKIIQDACNPCNEVLGESQEDHEMKSYSDDVLEDMK
ncbi:MAG: hypothetical protein HOD60_12555 [Candidatus Nitrosopelagicus sp.]|nr:hypothetical protein [Candidatus Nitrosopelagicus sp.]